MFIYWRVYLFLSSSFPSLPTPSHRQGPNVSLAHSTDASGLPLPTIGPSCGAHAAIHLGQGTQGDFSPDFTIKNGDINKKMVVYMIFSWDEWAFDVI